MLQFNKLAASKAEKLIFWDQSIAVKVPSKDLLGRQQLWVAHELASTR
jgi:hypothetical protein